MTRSLKLVPAESAPAHDDPIPFPGSERVELRRSTSGERTLAALDNVSRRLEDLARTLNCLGFFDEPDPDRPRAA